MNGIFTGAFVYADDISILAPSRYALNCMLSVCKDYALRHDILFNPMKTKCMIFNGNFRIPPLYFMNTQIEVVKSCVLLGVDLSSDSHDKCISKAVSKFNRRSNELRFDFNMLSSDIKSQLFSTYCLDAYGCQLWNLESKCIDQYYTAWRKMVRLLWRLPNTTHCNLLPGINGSLPIDVLIDKRCLKFIWSCLNSESSVVKLSALSATKTANSTFGDNYRFLSCKYSIVSHEWQKPYNIIMYRVDKYVTVLNAKCPPEANTIRELCICRDLNSHSLLTSTEMVQLIEYLCTI